MAEQTDNERNPDWHIIADTVQGATHQRNDKPNQDALAWRSTKEAIMLAISDGHGGDSYFRSDQGSKIAVEVAVDAMKELISENTTKSQDVTFIKEQTAELPKRIVTKWREKVKAHLDEVPLFTKEEWKRFHNQPALRADVSKNELIPYGATLLAMLVTETFIFCLQLGDGDITFVRANGQTVRPIAEDKRLLANETTSLCTDTAIKDFRQKFYHLKNAPPVLIMVSTDGYANSFSTPQGFLQVGVDILKKLYTEEDGLANVQSQFKEWLLAATKTGSGDDITVGIMCYLPTILQRPAPVIEPLPVEPAARLQVECQYRPRPDVSGASGGNLPGGTVNDKVPLNAPTERAPSPVQFKRPNTFAKDVEKDTHFPQYPRIHSKPLKSDPLKSSSEQQQQLVMVSQQGNGDCTTIREALEHVAPGGIIRVAPGIYRESLWIEKSIQLMAFDTGVTIEHTVPCLSISAQNVTVKGFKIIGITQDDTKKNNPAINIAARECHILECDISSQSICGIWVHGIDAKAVLINCKIHKTQGGGILFGEEAKGWLKNCNISSNQRFGVRLRGKSSLELEDCTIQQTEGKGIYINEGAMALINRCSIDHNKGLGIYIDNGMLRAIKCHIAGNEMDSILMKNGELVHLTDCTIDVDHGTGVTAISSKITIHGGSITTKRNKYALVFDQESRGDIYSCKITSEKKGILALSRADLKLVNCILDSQQCYVRAESYSKIICENCIKPRNDFYEIDDTGKVSEK